VSLVVFIVLGRTPLDPAHAAGVALIVLGGGGITMLFSALAVPSHATPQQRALARAYAHLAELARQPGADVIPPLSAPLADAEATLAAFGRARGTGDEPLRTLLDLAERLRVELVTLRTWASDAALSAGKVAGPLDEALAAAGEACERIAADLVATTAAGASDDELPRARAARRGRRRGSRAAPCGGAPGARRARGSAARRGPRAR